MDLGRDNINKIFMKYLAATFGGALISNIYTIVDCIVAGQYEGPVASAALATIAPLWNILFSVGLLFGIGGGVLLSQSRGAGDSGKGNRIFSASVICTVSVIIPVWLAVIFFDRQLLTFFGADREILPYALEYVQWLKLAAPLFTLGQVASVFIKNDGSPGITTAATVAGGVFNIAGDYYFVFTCDMGISGAGLATAIGQVIHIAILFSYFFTKKCGLRLVRPAGFKSMLKPIIATGFASFIVDIALGVVSTIFNNQIMFYLGADALAVYGVIVNVSTMVQCFGYGIGQAVQPIIAYNYGAKKPERIDETLKISAVFSFGLSALCFAFVMAFPKQITSFFMSATPSVLAAAPGIMRRYFPAFIFLIYNVVSTYYFQAILARGTSIFISVLRSVVLSSAMIYILPALFGGNALWIAMPVTEAAVFAVVAVCINRQRKRVYKELS